MTRLIDADYTKEHLRASELNGRRLHIMELEERLAVIDEVPTVDAVPVRHGRWIAHTMSEMTGYDPVLSGDDPVCSYSCSVCGEDCYVSDTGDDILSNYCPNCGARMDEEKEE